MTQFEKQLVIYEAYWRFSLLVTGIFSFLVCLFIWFVLAFLSVVGKIPCIRIGASVFTNQKDYTKHNRIRKKIAIHLDSLSMGASSLGIVFKSCITTLIFPSSL